jgi:lipopolysaccharide transport system ATP-binding protein
LKPFDKQIPQQTTEDFWALKDVSFEIKQGDRIGIIGRNGAGKSTLLKILSRITEPTCGRISINGRVASLLEVGTGFHPELTGRENIYLNGAILGMSKVEIKRKFDGIVAFAEVEKFLDTPVKRYSSGMYVRLAFAVAAHLEPEILIVDEVLAVGDAAFQKKCLGKMEDVGKDGRTVLFVSHSIAAITTLCRRCVLLNSGHMLMDGSAAEVTSYYQAQSFALVSNESELHAVERKGTGKAKFSAISIKPVSQFGMPLPVAYSGCNLAIKITIECIKSINDTNIAVIIYDINGYRLIDINTAQEGKFISFITGQKSLIQFKVKEVLLKPGTYFVGLWIGRGGIEEIDSIEYAAQFNIEDNPEETKHVEVFPGPYVCKFETSVTTN